MISDNCLKIHTQDGHRCETGFPRRMRRVVSAPPAVGGHEAACRKRPESLPKPHRTQGPARKAGRGETKSQAPLASVSNLRSTLQMWPQMSSAYCGRPAARSACARSACRSSRSRTWRRCSPWSPSACRGRTCGGDGRAASRARSTNPRPQTSPRDRPTCETCAGTPRSGGGSMWGGSHGIGLPRLGSGENSASARLAPWASRRTPSKRWAVAQASKRPRIHAHAFGIRWPCTCSVTLLHREDRHVWGAARAVCNAASDKAL